MTKDLKLSPEHPKYGHFTGVFPSDVGSKKSRKGENVRWCECSSCKTMDLDDNIQNKCPRCDQWVKIESITDGKGRLLAEICPECKRRAEEKMSIYFKFFTAEDCPNCVSAKPAIDEIDKMGYKITEYKNGDIDGLAEASYYSVAVAPTLIMFSGKKEVMRWDGKITKKEVMEDLKGHT